MPNVRLQKIAVDFWGESELVLSRFRHIFAKGHETCSASHGWTQEMSVVRLQDSWSRFCRELVIISASERPVTAAGTLVPLAPGISRRSDALNALHVVYTRPPYEPKWFDAQACLRAASILRLNNYASVSGGIGVTPSPLDDLRALRNFLAHRSQMTATGVRDTAIRNSLPPKSGVIAILQSDSTNPGMTILQLWVKQLQTMALIAVR
jgi:hypothetical protein